MAKTKSGKTELSAYRITGSYQVIRAGDNVMIKPARKNAAPYVARVEKIEVDKRNKVTVCIRWYYRPEDTFRGRMRFHGSKELFISEHFDTQSVDTIQGKCTVHNFSDYTKLINVEPQDYYCRFEYRPITRDFVPDCVAVYCKCEQPNNPDYVMIECQGCGEWFHPKCINMTIEQAKRLDHVDCSVHDGDR